MKKVRIKYDCIKPELDSGQYRVWLGDYNEQGSLNYHYFSSEKKAEAFVKKTNKFLTDMLHELNMLYARVSFEYRVNWAVFSDTSEAFKLERKITQNLRFCDDNFNKIFSLVRCENKHLGSYTFKLLNCNCDYLTEVVNILIEQNQKRSSTNLVYSYKFILNDLLRIKDKISGYCSTTLLYVTNIEPIKAEVNPAIQAKIDAHNQKVRAKNEKLKTQINGRNNIKRRKKLQLRDRHRPKNNISLSQAKVNDLRNNGGINNP